MDRVAYNAMLAQYATPEVSGNGRVSWDKGVRCVIPSVTLYGKCEQDGTPTPDAPIPIKCNNGVFAARGSNLFNIAGRERGDLVSSSQNQQFSGDKYYYRVSSNNYYKNEDFSVGDVQIDPENNSVSLQTKYSGYGLGFDFKTLPNKTYRLMAEVTGVCLIGVSFYTPGGTHISWVNITSLPSTFTTPDGTGWMVIIFRPYLDRGTYYNIRLTCGEEAAYTPYYDGGQATAPELWAIPGTDIRDEWDAQTGKLTRAIWDEIVLDGSSDETWRPYTSSRYIGFYVYPCLSESMSRNACISNYFGTQEKGEQIDIEKGRLWCGVRNSIVYVINPGDFYDETLDDKGLANWKAHLAEHPLRILVARNEPLVTYTTPQKLTQPNGPGQIIQVSGSVPDCPIEAAYLTHS